MTIWSSIFKTIQRASKRASGMGWSLTVVMTGNWEAGNNKKTPKRWHHAPIQVDIASTTTTTITTTTTYYYHYHYHYHNNNNNHQGGHGNWEHGNSPSSEKHGVRFVPLPLYNHITIAVYRSHKRFQSVRSTRKLSKKHKKLLAIAGLSQEGSTPTKGYGWDVAVK